MFRAIKGYNCRGFRTTLWAKRLSWSCENFLDLLTKVPGNQSEPLPNRIHPTRNIKASPKPRPSLGLRLPRRSPKGPRCRGCRRERLRRRCARRSTKGKRRRAAGWPWRSVFGFVSHFLVGFKPTHGGVKLSKSTSWPQ